MPRGRPDPLGQVPDGGRVHLVPDLEILEQDRAEFDQAQGRLAPGDDGVHAGTVAVVGADAAVAITVESGGVTARAAIALAGDEIDERCFLGLLHVSLSLILGSGRGGARVCRRDPDRSPARGVFGSIRRELPIAKREKTRPPQTPPRSYGPVPARKYSASPPISWTVSLTCSSTFDSTGLVVVGEPNASIPWSRAIRRLRSM